MRISDAKLELAIGHPPAVFHVFRGPAAANSPLPPLAMKKIALLSAVAAAVLFLGALGVTYWKRLAPPAVRPDALLPGGTLMLVEAVDLTRTAQRWDKTELNQLWEEPEVQAFLEKP